MILWLVGLSASGKTTTERNFSVEARAVREERAGELCAMLDRQGLDVCVLRDPEGLYLRALRGDVTGVVGLDLEHEPPRSPDLTVDNGHPSVDAATLALRILAAAHRKQRQSLAQPPLASPAAAGATA